MSVPCGFPVPRTVPDIRVCSEHSNYLLGELNGSNKDM